LNEGSASFKGDEESALVWNFVKRSSGAFLAASALPTERRETTADNQRILKDC
jgi:hypothetical protein